MKQYTIPIYADVIDFTMNGLDAKNAICYQLALGDPLLEEIAEEIRETCGEEAADTFKSSSLSLRDYIMEYLNILSINADETYELNDPQCVAFDISFCFDLERFAENYSKDKDFER